MQAQLAGIKDVAEQFRVVVDCFASSVTPPIMYDSGEKHKGFRYMNPTAKHYCTLKAVRAVSALNAAIVLAENGFNQEVCVLIRTILDCTSHIDFVLAGLDNGVLQEKQQKIVEAYFKDFRRNNADDFTGPTTRQENIHEEIGRYLEDVGATGGNPSLSKTPAKTLMSNVYRNFSNYMHARYPEVMDMFGGTPGRFHMTGMSRTPKDGESLAILTTFADSISLTLGHMISKFNMHDEIRSIPQVAHWIKAD